MSLSLILTTSFALAFGLNASAATQSNLTVLDTVFEPLREGKNVLYVEVQNQTPDEQIFGVHVQTKAAGSAQPWGWGRSFFATVAGGQKSQIRIPYKVYAPLTDATWIRIQYYNPPSPAEYDFEKWFKQVRYMAADLPRWSGPAASQPASAAEEKLALETWRTLQKHLRAKDYALAWELFTTDLKQIEFSEAVPPKNQGLEDFRQAMDLPVRFWWSRPELIAMQPQTVARGNDELVLTASLRGSAVPVHLVQAERTWRIDSIGVFTPTVEWKQRLLPLMRQYATEHFDVHFLPASTAEKEIARIAESREDALRRVCELAGEVPTTRISVILFEDGESKRRVTGHQGDGWAFGDTVVEVYNEQTRLDPNHEISHVVMRNIGSPPALFNEGLAVWLQASHTWQDEAVDVTAARLAAEGRLTPISKLITRTEIGAINNDGQVAYPEAASFVGFLIDRYGKERFLQAYRVLENGGERQRNLERIRQVYGRPLSELESEWRQRLGQATSRPASRQ